MNRRGTFTHLIWPPRKGATHLKWRKRARCMVHRARLESNVRSCCLQALFPAKCASGLIFDDTCLKKVAFFFKIDHFSHPWEWIFFLRKQGFQTDLLAATIGDEAQVGLEHRCVQTEHAAGHGVLSVSIFKL